MPRSRPRQCGEAVDLVDHHHIDVAGFDVIEKPGEGRAVRGSAREATIVIEVGESDPALVLLADDERLAGLSLRIERVERLVQAFFG